MFGLIGALSTPVPLWAAECVALDPSEVRVVDGDTFDAGTVEVRVNDIVLGTWQLRWRLTAPTHGVDTPETHRPGCAYEKELGERATERLQELIQGGDLVACTDGKRTRGQRLLGTLSAQGRDVGTLLIAEGLAQRWPREWEWCE